MTHIDHHHGSWMLIEDRSPMTAVLILLAVTALTAFLIWLFAFSGVIFDDSPDTIIQPPSDTGGTSGDTGGTSGDTGTTGGGTGTGSSP